MHEEDEDWSRVINMTPPTECNNQTQCMTLLCVVYACTLSFCCHGSFYPYPSSCFNRYFVSHVHDANHSHHLFFTFSPLRYLVSPSNIWNPQRRYDCPTGYHWMTTTEAEAIFLTPQDTYRRSNWHSNAHAEIELRHGRQGYTDYDTDEYSLDTSVEDGSLYFNPEPFTYAGQCGWIGARYSKSQSLQNVSVTRRRFRFADSVTTGAYKDSLAIDSLRPSYDPVGQFEVNEFAGIVCLANHHTTNTSTTSTTARGSGNSELWRTDGTVENTARVWDISPVTGSHPKYLASCGGFLYFAATTTTEGEELWRLPTETENSKQIPELITLPGIVTRKGLGKPYPQEKEVSGGIYPGATSSHPSHLVCSDDSNGVLMFSATNPHIGRELYILSPLDSTYYTLHGIDINKGTTGSNPLNLAVSNIATPSGFIMFAATDLSLGTELYRSDGTDSGTYLVSDINSGASASYPKYLTYFSQTSRFYFQADDGVHGVELWSSDGTSSGTAIIRDISQGTRSSNPSFLTVMSLFVNGVTKEFLYFTATDGLRNNYLQGGEISKKLKLDSQQLWVSDGSFTGTVRAFDHAKDDFFIDRKSMNAAWPARLGIFNPATESKEYRKQSSFLYITSSIGDYDHNIISPKGGLDSGLIITSGSSSSISAERISGYQVTQALTIIDLDTHSTTQNVSLTLHVDKGLLITPTVISDSITDNTPFPLKVLIVESDENARQLLLNAFLAPAIREMVLVTILGNGKEALDLISSSSFAAATSTIDQKNNEEGFDLLITSINLNPKNTYTSPTSTSQLWDGLALTRQLRHFNYNLTIVTLAENNELIPANEAESLLSGADYFFFKPPAENVKTPATLNREIKLKQQADYAKLASQILTTVTRVTRVFNITATCSTENLACLEENRVLAAQQLSNFSMSSLSIGDTLQIEGSASEVNEIMKKLFFFAPLGAKSTGAVSMTVTASNPFTNTSSSRSVYDARTQGALGGCGLQSSLLAVQSSVEYYPAYPTGLPYNSKPSTPTQEEMLGLCNINNNRSLLTTVRSIDLYVTAVNLPPTVTFPTSITTPTQVTVDTPLTLPAITLADNDSETGASTISSKNQVTLPNYALILSTTGLGRITLVNRPQAVVITSGTGYRDRFISLLGSLATLRATVAAAHVRYECLAADGCFASVTDAIIVTLNDLGNYGLGGPMTGGDTLSVTVIAA